MCTDIFNNNILNFLVWQKLVSVSLERDENAMRCDDAKKVMYLFLDSIIYFSETLVKDMLKWQMKKEEEEKQPVIFLWHNNVLIHRSYNFF